MVWIPKEPQYKPKPPKPTNTPTNTPTNLISRLDAIDAICKDWCNTTYKDCKTPFNQETDEYYHCDGCGDVETLLALPSTDASADRPRGEWVDKGNWMGLECSRCKCHNRYVTPFCPNCGADMRATERNTNHSRETPTK